jgi:hypothetical protein
MPRAFAFLFASLLALLFAPACGHDPGGTGGDASTGVVVVGITSDLRVGVDLERVHVVMRAAGAVLSDQSISVSGTPALKLPGEVAFPPLPGGTAIEATLEAYGPGGSPLPLVTRLAATTVVAGQKLLMVVRLDSRCIVAPGSSAPTCTAPQTCSAGVCIDEHVPSSTLPVYSPSWSSASTDPCKPAGGGAPVVIIGQGQADYLPLMDGDTAQVEAGPQGGHHIWVALRAKNLHQSGTITSITGHFPDLNIDVGPFNVIFTMETDEGGYCKLYGLRFQLDQSTDIQQLLGHPLDVTVTMTDSDMDVGTGKRSVVLSQTYIQ